MMVKNIATALNSYMVLRDLVPVKARLLLRNCIFKNTSFCGANDNELFAVSKDDVVDISSSGVDQRQALFPRVPVPPTAAVAVGLFLCWRIPLFFSFISAAMARYPGTL